MSKVVINSTPIISLSLIKRLSILKQLFNEVVIPESVFYEITKAGKNKVGAKETENAKWLTIMSPDSTTCLPPFLLGLDQGEMDVIILAKNLNADFAIIDEKAGRRVAKAVGLKVKGTLGVLLNAYDKCLLNKKDMETIIVTLENSFLRISPKLIKWFKEQLKQ